jgi:hypothetical protein
MEWIKKNKETVIGVSVGTAVVALGIYFFKRSSGVTTTKTECIKPE